MNLTVTHATLYVVSHSTFTAFPVVRHPDHKHLGEGKGYSTANSRLQAIAECKSQALPTSHSHIKSRVSGVNPRAGSLLFSLDQLSSSCTVQSSAQKTGVPTFSAGLPTLINIKMSPPALSHKHKMTPSPANRPTGQSHVYNVSGGVLFGVSSRSNFRLWQIDI